MYRIFIQIRVPYVRHYVLLGALHTRFVWIQGIFNEAFEDLPPVKVLEDFSSPKLAAVLDILRRYDLTTPHESKVARDAEEEEDSENELTVADYLEQQKQAEEQAAASRGGKFFGRRKHHHRSKADVLSEKERRKQHFLEKQVKFQQEGAETGKIETAPATAPAVEDSENKSDPPVSKEEPNSVSSTALLVDVVPGSEKANNSEDPESTSASAPIETEKETTEGPSLNGKKAGHAPILKYQRRNKFVHKVNEDALCGILLCEDRFIARLL